jgi:hypothetical protein
MRRQFLLRRVPVIAAGILSTTSIASCAHRNNVYDPVYSDNHRWNAREDAAYRRWEAERNSPHADYSRRNADEQRSYWQWRHNHPDR